MRGLGLGALLAALSGCSSSVNDCTSACSSLVECLASPGCEQVCTKACPPLCHLESCNTVCNPAYADNAALAEADCNDACASQSSSKQGQILQCVKAATSCQEALVCF
jgi:hypothetical protein